MWMNYSNRKPDAVSTEKNTWSPTEKPIEVYRPTDDDTHYHFVYESDRRSLVVNIRRTDRADSMIQVQVDETQYPQYGKKRAMRKILSFDLPQSLVQLFIEACTTPMPHKTNSNG